MVRWCGLFLLAALSWAAPTQADELFYATPYTGQNTKGSVISCLNDSLVAIPCGQRFSRTVTILSGASLSGAVNIGNGSLFAIQMPASWTAAGLTFQASSDCSAYANLYNDAGTEVTSTAAASTYIVMATPASWLGIRCLKVRSGTSGSPVAQGADRALTIIAVP